MSLNFGIKEFPWREGHPPLPRETLRETGQRGCLIQSARKLYEAHGAQKTTIASVCSEAGITRELFYYYFPSKEALTQAVLDDYIADFTESVILWNESRVKGEISLELRKYVHMFRRCLFDESNHERAMFRVAKELNVEDAVISTAVYEMTRYLNEGALKEYARYHKVEIDLAAEMIYSSIFGLIGLLLIDPDISDIRLAKVYQQTLHLDVRAANISADDSTQASPASPTSIMQ